MARPGTHNGLKRTDQQEDGERIRQLDRDGLSMARIRQQLGVPLSRIMSTSKIRADTLPLPSRAMKVFINWSGEQSRCGTGSA